MKDHRDKNMDIITMFRGTDKTYQFQYTLDSGSVFVPSQYNIVCEGRLAYGNETKDFEFPVTEVIFEDESYLVISFPKTLVTSNIRENKIYFKVFATRDVEGGETIVINYGELWLK
jgi:hypothetical protein